MQLMRIARMLQRSLDLGVDAQAILRFPSF